MRTQGGGGVKKRSNFSDVLYGWPLRYTHTLVSIHLKFWYMCYIFMESPFYYSSNCDITGVYSLLDWLILS